MTPRHPELAPHSQPLLESEVSADPFEQFEEWYAAAAETTRIVEAAALATVGADGRPSLRMVLVQGRSEAGFDFFTNYGSRKGSDLSANSAAALLFYWDGLGRQVRITGSVSELSADESDAYFATRPRGAQVSAWASRQSAPVADRATLESAFASAAERFAGVDVERPPWWGGYRLEPETFEFWQNRDDRLHDRLVYSPAPAPAPAGGKSGWVIGRLQP